MLAKSSSTKKAKKNRGKVFQAEANVSKSLKVDEAKANSGSPCQLAGMGALQW